MSTNEELLEYCEVQIANCGDISYMALAVATALRERLIKERAAQQVNTLLNDPKANFTKLGTDLVMAPCRYCKHPAELWELDGAAGKVKSVMCSNNSETLDDEACPLVLPPINYYAATRREAVEYWNRKNSAAPKEPS